VEDVGKRAKMLHNSEYGRYLHELALRGY